MSTTQEKTSEEPRLVSFNKDPELDQRYASFFSLWQDYKKHKEQPVRFLQKQDKSRNILDYVQDGVDRMNEFHLKPVHKEDWQQNVFDPITRDKLIFILSQLAASRMKPELIIKPLSIFHLVNTQIRQEVFSDLLEAANYHNMDDAQLVWELYTMLSEGTVFGYEGWLKGKHEVEFIEDMDPDTGKYTSKKMTVNDWDDVFGQIVPIEEIYPESIWVNAKDFNQSTKRVFWAKKMPIEKFYDQFSNFKNAKKVQKASYYEQEGQFPWGIPADIKPNYVLVLQWFDAAKDRMGIWANGQEIYWGPLPFNHKRIPFWCGIGEPIHQQFLFGKSMPDKLMGMQDINNGVFNAMLDQLYMALHSPIFIDGMSNLDEGYLEPGRIYEVDPGAKMQQAKIGSIDNSAFGILQLIRRSLEESSVSAQAAGVPTGGRKTKYEVQLLNEGAMNIASLALQMMENSMRQKYWLRMYNILQYYSMPSSKKSGKARFKYIEIDNRKLSNGNIGKRAIQIVANASEKPRSEDLQKVVSMMEGKPFDPLKSKVESIVITRDFLMNREFDLEMRIVPNASAKETLIDKKNKNITFYNAAVGNPLFDQTVVARNFARDLDQDEDVIAKNPQGQPSPSPIGAEQLIPGVQL